MILAPVKAVGNSMNRNIIEISVNDALNFSPKADTSWMEKMFKIGSELYGHWKSGGEKACLDKIMEFYEEVEYQLIDKRVRSACKSWEVDSARRILRIGPIAEALEKLESKINDLNHKIEIEWERRFHDTAWGIFSRFAKSVVKYTSDLTFIKPMFDKLMVMRDTILKVKNGRIYWDETISGMMDVYDGSEQIENELADGIPQTKDKLFFRRCIVNLLNILSIDKAVDEMVGKISPSKSRIKTYQDIFERIENKDGERRSRNNKLRKDGKPMPSPLGSLQLQDKNESAKRNNPASPPPPPRRSMMHQQGTHQEHVGGVPAPPPRRSLMHQ